MPEEDRATAIGNMNKNLLKIACVWFRRYPRGNIEKKVHGNNVHGKNVHGKMVHPKMKKTNKTSTVSRNKNSSGDEIANVLVNDDIAHTLAYFNIPKKRQTYFV